MYFDLGESGGLVMALSLNAGSSQYPSDDDCVETNLCDSPMMMSGDVLYEWFGKWIGNDLCHCKSQSINRSSTQSTHQLKIHKLLTLLLED